MKEESNKINREDVFSWWNKLDGSIKIKCTKDYYPTRSYWSLTGPEIEKIYFIHAAQS